MLLGITMTNSVSSFNYLFYVEDWIFIYHSICIKPFIFFCKSTYFTYSFQLVLQENNKVD